ncbi:hypothetical protein ACLWBD_01770 [Bdellovibrio sp. HCB117]|uniref:hypothetical protein n=1 Tax=Bdellovibrio sp. HCB117 TaxID=3394359 RepID=UPI0039B44979
MSTAKYLVLLVVTLMLATACEQQIEDDGSSENDQATNPTRFLYIASGSCYAGGPTPTSPSRTISRVNLATGNIHDIIVDYNAASPGDAPVAVINHDDSTILSLVENTSGRRVDRVTKSSNGNQYQTYFTNSTALNAVMRSMIVAADGALLISKSSSIEKFAAKSRVGTAAYVNAPGGACATTTTLISSVAVTPTYGHILYTHAAAAPNNKLNAIKSTGYVSAADCLASTSLTPTTALPTAMVYIPASNDVLVATGSTTAASNMVISYPITETASTVTIGAPTVAYNNTSVIYGPSAMAYDSETGFVYIANGSTSLANVIEKFTYDSTTKTLTRVGTVPFTGTSLQTNCISSMFVGN